MKKRFSEEQIIGFLHEADAGLAIKELCREHGISSATFYKWRAKFDGMDASLMETLAAAAFGRHRIKIWQLRSCA